MKKIIEIETCSDCIHCGDTYVVAGQLRYYSNTADGCYNPDHPDKGESRWVIIDPDSPLPENCPLLDMSEYIKVDDALAILHRIIDNALYTAPGIYLSFKNALESRVKGGGDK